MLTLPVTSTDSKLQRLMAVDLAEVAKPRPIVEDANSAASPDDDTVHFLCVLVECLALLRRLPEAIDVSLPAGARGGLPECLRLGAFTDLLSPPSPFVVHVQKDHFDT